MALMPRTHGENKSILFAQISDPYEVTLLEFAQIKDDLFAHVYKALPTGVKLGLEIWGYRKCYNLRNNGMMQ